MIDWTILFSSICAFIFPGVILLEDTLSVIKYYNQIIKEKNPRKFTILSIAMYGFIIFLGFWLVIYAIWGKYILLVAWCLAFLAFIIVVPFMLFIMHKLLLDMVGLVRTYENIDVDYWKRVEDKADVFWLTSIIVFVVEGGFVIYFLVNILK